MYSRVIDGQILTLSASGWTYDDTFVLFDYETESLWYHLPRTSGLTCIAGYYVDRKLGEYKSSLTRWSDWIIYNKQSKILKQPTGPLIYDPY